MASSCLFTTVDCFFVRRNVYGFVFIFVNTRIIGLLEKLEIAAFDGWKWQHGDTFWSVNFTHGLFPYCIFIFIAEKRENGLGQK
jgi:hypothetical protein